MSWNVNSLANDNFQRVRLIEAHSSIFNYDLISICETSLNDSVELPATLLNDYTFVSANNPVNTRHGGVGLFYKNSLPVITSNDLSFDETIVVELKFGRKNLFLLFYIELFLLTIPLLNFKILSNFESLYSKIKTENSFATFFQVILIHTPSFGGDNSRRHKNRRCIDLVDSGTRASLDSYCHHQIVHCKVIVRILSEYYHLIEKYGTLIDQTQLLLKGAWPVIHGVNNSTITPIPTGKSKHLLTPS